ncbi:MAG TPA: hypothetical protein VIH71_02455 [Solirubrobacteraceae bacterium]
MGGKRVSGKDGKDKATKRVTERPGITEPSDRHLVWRFGRLDHDTAFRCQNLLNTDVREVEKELETFQGELISALRQKRWLKFIPAGDMTQAGQRALWEVNDKEEGLWQLHLLRYKWRIWGYFEDPKFFFVFWDCNHDIATGNSRTRNA